MARFVCFVAGTQWLYTIGDTLVPIVIILVTLILSGIMAYYWDKHEYKYTLDRFERRFMR